MRLTIKARLFGLTISGLVFVAAVVRPEIGESQPHKEQRWKCRPRARQFESTSKPASISDALVELILCHHDVAADVINPALVAIGSLSDRLGRASDPGLSYAEQPDPIDLWEGDWKILADKCPLAAGITWSEFAKESANYVGEIHKLVDPMYTGG